MRAISGEPTHRRDRRLLRGIHLSMADRLVRLLRSARINGRVVLTGGLPKDIGLVDAVEHLAAADRRVDVQLETHPDAVLAGALGASLWAAHRHRMLQRRAPEAAVSSNTK